MPDPALITPLGWELLGELPPRVFEDPDIRAVVHCQAKESERQRELAARVRDNFIPARLDELGLPWWERLYLLSDPTGLTEVQRRERVLVRTRQTQPRVSSREFKEDMDDLIGEGNWKYEEEYPAIRVSVPFKPGSEAFLQLEDLIRNLPTFPCHLDVILETIEGFVLDQSLLDQEPFEAE